VPPRPFWGTLLLDPPVKLKVARHEIRFNNPSYVGSATASHQFTFGEASFGVTKRAHSPIVSMAHKDIVVAPVMATPTDLGFHVGLLTPLQKSRPGDESIGVCTEFPIWTVARPLQGWLARIVRLFYLVFCASHFICHRSDRSREHFCSLSVCRSGRRAD